MTLGGQLRTSRKICDDVGLQLPKMDNKKSILNEVHGKCRLCWPLHLRLWIPKATDVSRINVRKRSGARRRLESVSLGLWQTWLSPSLLSDSREGLLCCVTLVSQILLVDPKVELHRMQVS